MEEVMIKLYRLLLIFTIVLVFTLIGCDIGVDDNDDDKESIDWYSHQQIMYANVDGYTITGTGYSSGGGPWFFGTDVMAIVFVIEACNDNDTENRHVQFAFGDDNSEAGNPLSFTLSPKERLHFNTIIRINEYSENDRFWVNGDYSNLTDVTIHVTPLFYWRGF